MPESSPQGAPIDRYVVLKYLAEGGMGAIYLGKKLGAGGFEKEVVLKQLLPEFTSQPEFIDLFLREARLSATLDHANIIHTIDLVTAGDEYFIVMEYLDGGDLRGLLKRAKRAKRLFSAAAGVYIAREVLSALAYAHNKIGPHGKPLNLIHRDVSPSNILISRNGEVKLSDFGIAKASTHNSVFYRVKGKVGYMSPEQARNEPLDHRSDLYSLAVCIYEVITGERLFVSAGLTTSAEEIYDQPIEPLGSKVPGLPPELDEVMMRALAMSPDDRYQSAGEFQEALLRCAHRCGLMMSTPELADHLRDVCGRPEHWRQLDGGTEEAGLGHPGGTEIYEEIDGTEQLQLSDIEFDFGDEDEDLISIVLPDAQVQVFNERKARRERANTSLTNLTRLKNLELTSMINIGDMEDAGAKPLVDLDDLGPEVDAPLPSYDAQLDEVHSPFDDERFDSGLIDAPQDGTGVEFDSELEEELSDGTKRPNDLDEGFGDELDDDFDDELDPDFVHAPIEHSEPGETVAVEDREESARRPWLIVAVILLAGIAVATAIALSGPKLSSSDRDSRGQQQSP